MDRSLFANWVPCHSHSIVGIKSHLLLDECQYDAPSKTPLIARVHNYSNAGTHVASPTVLNRRQALQIGAGGIAAGLIVGSPRSASANFAASPSFWGVVAEIVAIAFVKAAGWFLEKIFAPIAAQISARMLTMINTAIDTIEHAWNKFWESIGSWLGYDAKKAELDPAYKASTIPYNDKWKFPDQIRFEPQKYKSFGVVGIAEQYEPHNMNAVEQIYLANGAERFLSSELRLPSVDPVRNVRDEDRWYKHYRKEFDEVNTMYKKKFTPADVVFAVPLTNDAGQQEVGFAIKRKSSTGRDQIGYFTSAKPAEGAKPPKEVRDAVKTLWGPED